MAWRDWLGLAAPVPSAPPNGHKAITAAATIVTDDPGRQITPVKSGWQAELWEYYDTLGEFAFVVDWKAAMLSRVRLRAGKKNPNSDEPTIVTTGYAADIVQALGGGTGGQADIMTDMEVQLSIPGEGWLIGQEIDGEEKWRVVSSDEIRVARGRGRATVYEVIDEQSPPNTPEWVELPANSMVVRVWRPHRRMHYAATSPARAARTTMRELELVNRKIQAQYISRLASAGMLIMPDEVEFPVREEFLEAANPFMSELIAIASEAIATPGSAAAAVPIPILVPAEYTDNIRHIDFTLRMDEREAEKRDQVLRRLAIQLDVPSEILTGLGEINHWGAWAIEESAVKTHLCPDVELICWGLTVGYLHPRLRAAGESVDDWVVWYDASEIIQRPDRSRNANDAYDRLEISPTAYRRENGFDEADKPTDVEVEQMALRKLATVPTSGFTAIDLLMGREPVTPGGETPPIDEPAPVEDDTGPPKTEGKPAPSQDAQPRQAAASLSSRLDALTERLVAQAKTQHALTFSATGKPLLQHAKTCSEHLGSCPFTHALARGLPVWPGTSGTYECRLADGRLVIGTRIFPAPDELIAYPTPNGARHGIPART